MKFRSVTKGFGCVLKFELVSCVAKKDNACCIDAKLFNKNTKLFFHPFATAHNNFPNLSLHMGRNKWLHLSLWPLTDFGMLVLI